MKGIESLLASMIGVDANKMQEMMSGFIDNAAYLAKGIYEIKASILSIEANINDISERISRLEDKIIKADVINLIAIENKETDNVKSND